jgi:peroxiredoxin Q/BCP
LASYARSWNRFETEGVELAGISVDPTENNRAMVEKLLLPFPLLSDPEGRVIKAWGVWNEGERIAKPAIFAIRRDGSLASKYVGRDFADRPTDDKVFDSVNSISGGA